MKVGILTYHRSHNYGAMLQAYALQTFLEESGHKVNILDYWPKYHSDEYAFFPRFSNEMSYKEKLKIIIYFCAGFFRIFKRHRGYQRFIKEHFKLQTSPRYTTAESTNTSIFDALIYGSDQIWRKQDFPLFKGFNDIYFGNHSSSVPKKISYAASMGVIKLQGDDIAFLKKMMSNFETISVREYALKKVIEEVTNFEVSLVLDPVFLLSKKKWTELIPKRRILDKYILLYQIVNSADSVLFTNKLREHFGYRVIEIRGRVNPFLYGSRYKQTESPFAFLSLLKNAEFVVSTSFHGVAFSLIFEKQFYAIGMGDKSGRALNLLSSLEIEYRYLDDINDIDTKEVIDYKKVLGKLKESRDYSILYLKHAIHGGEN